MNLQPKGQLYVVLVSTAGLLVVGHCISQLLSSPIGWEWVILAGLTLLSGSFTVRIPRLPARISVSETFVFTSVLLFGTCAGTLTVSLDILVASLTSRRRAREPIRVLFNLAAAALSIWTAGSLFYMSAGIAVPSVAPARVPELLSPLILMTSIYFLLNSGLVAVALAIESNKPAFAIWRKHFLWLSVNYFGGASVSALLVSYTRTIDFSALSIIVPLLVISYLTYKTSLGRVEDAMQHLDEVNRLYMSTIETLATAIDAKDQVTHGHIRRVQRFALALAKELGMAGGAQLQALEAAALLHDMGKIAVPEHILNKPSRLSSGEFEKMKLHASVGAEILSSVPFPYPVVPIVRHHHENWDGSGYPDGLRGTDIPLGARILAVVDCFDALTSDRPYRPRLPDEEAIRVLLQRRGSMYDPLVVDSFIAVKDELARMSPEAMVGHVEELVKESLREAPGSRGSVHQALMVHLELRHALRAVLTVVNGETRAQLSAVYVKVPHRDELVVADAFGSDADALVGNLLPLGTRISGWVAANGRAIINADARIELPAHCESGKHLLCAAVPIVVSGGVIGVVAAFRTGSWPFNEAEIGYLERVASRFSEEPLKGALGRALDSKASPQASRSVEKIH